MSQKKSVKFAVSGHSLSPGDDDDVRYVFLCFFHLTTNPPHFFFF